MAVKRDNNTNKWYYYGSYKIGNKTKQYKSVALTENKTQ